MQRFVVYCYRADWTCLLRCSVLRSNMDKETVVMLLEQQLETVKSFVQLMVSNLREDVKELQRENQELRHSLEFTQSEVADLKVMIADHSQSFGRVEVAEDHHKEVWEIVRRMEDEARKNNVRLEGLSEVPNENSEQTQAKLESLLRDKMEVNVRLESANRFGRTSVPGRPRTVVARFGNFADRQNVSNRAPNCKGPTYLLMKMFLRTVEIRKEKKS